MNKGTQIRLRAQAKVNLYLGVQPDVDHAGYHMLDTIMHGLDLHDTLELSFVPAQSAYHGDELYKEELLIRLNTSPSLHIPCEQNLAYRAAHLLHQTICPEIAGTLHIQLAKVIPHQAGLGGGSSDAAAVIRGLISLWGLDQSDQRIVQVAQLLGADVAFFLQDPLCPAYLTHRGDVLQQRLMPLTGRVLLVRPDAPVSTAQAYRLFDERPAPPQDTLQELLAKMEATSVHTGDGRLAADQVHHLFANNLTHVACELQPAVARVMQYLTSLNLNPVLCGSGSAVFAVLDDDADVLQIERALEDFSRTNGDKLWVLPTRFC